MKVQGLNLKVQSVGIAYGDGTFELESGSGQQLSTFHFSLVTKRSVYGY